MDITLPEAAWEGTDAEVEALLDRWQVKEGDVVRHGQPLATAVLVKSSQDIEAPADGRVTHLLVGAGDTFRRGQPVATLEPGP